MKHYFCFIITLASLFALGSCKKYDLAGLFFGSSPSVDERFKVSTKYNDSRGTIRLESSRDDYRVYVCTDIHIEGDTRNARRFVDACLSDADAEKFSICLGDLVSCSGNHQLARKTLEPLDSASRKLFCVVGNHDIQFSQWEEYVSYWKTASYSFEILTPDGSKDFYICLDSASGTLGTAQINWLKSLLSDTSCYRNVIVLTHTHFFKKDNSQGHTSNFNLDETYMLLDLFSRSGVDCVLTGHDHFQEETVFRGVSYYILEALEPGHDTYYIATVSDGVSLEAVK